MKENYTVIHCHSDYSNGTTNIDSVTKYNHYIEKAKELGMKAIAITEHGNIFDWYKKKELCDKLGVKYIHGVEVYITKSLREEVQLEGGDTCSEPRKVRDNYHCILLAKNHKGFLEINKLVSKAHNRKDGHYYYAPRITFEDLINTSNNIIVTSACIGGIYGGNDNELKLKLTNFMINNKDRCFLEIQHHLDERQAEHNKLLYNIHKETGINMVVATDTHALNKTHAKGRTILQKAKKIFFSNESGWDITFKTYDELIELFKKQNAIPIEDVKIALENTNKIADMVEFFEFNISHKYPKLYSDSMNTFLSKIKDGIKRRGIDKKDNYKVYQERILEEIETYKKVNAIDYILLQAKIIEDGKEQGEIEHGFGRGSVTGSVIAYILGITEMDSIKYNLNFFRFLNPSRLTNADIDIDFSEKDREWIRNYIFNMQGIKAADIITFNTIALKGAIRDVCRALDVPLSEVSYICENVDNDEDRMRKEYPEVFEYVDIVKGTIVSVGSHPSGILVSDLDIEEEIGLCTLSGNENFVSQLSMKPLDALWFVKLDVLGLDSINIINETCKLANIQRLTPDNIDLYDEKVWDSIRKDTTAIFQMESSMAHKYFKDITRPEVIEKIKKSIPNIRMFDLFMFICGAIRPAGENFRDDASNGIIKDNGFKELNEFLHNTLGYLLLQEQIMQFLVKFCGYTDAESDNVRRAISKKGDTTPMLREIEERFLEYTPKTFNVSLDVAKEIIKPFILDIKSASGYGFSENHNNPYSITGYCQGWLRYYHPLEFITICLNTWSLKEDKMLRMTEYAAKRNIKINPPKFRYSSGRYTPNKDTNTIYKGIASIKFCNETIGNELYSLKNNNYKNFLALLLDITDKTSCDMRQLEILIKLGFFIEFGRSNKLLVIFNIFNNIYHKKQFKKDNIPNPLTYELLKKYANKETEKIFKEVDMVNMINELIESLEDRELSVAERVKAELEYVGYIQIKDKAFKPSVMLVTELKVNKWGTAFASLYRLNDGSTTEIKIDKMMYQTSEIKTLDMIQIVEITSKFKKRKVEGKWTQTDEKEYILTKYAKVVE